MPRFKIPGVPERYDFWVDTDHQNRRHVAAAVAALLGLDPRRARKLLDSGSPICWRVRRGQAEYLRDRFAAWGLAVYIEPDLPERPSKPAVQILLEHPSEDWADEPFGCLQAPLGFVLGGLAAFVLAGVDPFGVLAFPFPQGVDPAVAHAAYVQWKNSPGRILGQLAMAWVPLLVSGLCGVFVHPSRPASILAALLRTMAVASLLSLVLWAGMPKVEQALGTGQSSDIQGAVASLAFAALCMALAAPLSSIVTRRRSFNPGGLAMGDSTEKSSSS